MAIARLSVKVGKAGKAAHHAAYIARMGRYASRLEKGERLVASEVGNMPAWVRDNPLSFWEAADAFERKNGSVYREMEIALPRELDPEQQIALVRDWVQQEIGNKHAYQWAIHAPKAADGKEQPHVHLLFSERTLDGIERGRDQFFKRYNAKAPERGGCKKANTGLDKETRREQLKALRERWQVVCNRALERAGQDARIDMRSDKDQGLDIQPEKKMLPSEWRQENRRAEVIEFRTARAERLAAQRDLRREVPDAGAEIIELQARRQEQEAQRKAAQQIGELLTSAEALLGTGKPAKAPKWPSPEMDALQELINADQRAGRRGVSASRPEPARAPEKAAAPVIPPKATEPSPTVPAAKQAPPPAPAQEPKKAPPEWLRRAKEEDQRRRASWERYERDRSTEQETRPGIRHPSKPRWQTEREAILAAKYGEDVASRLGKWYRIERQGDALVLKNAQATITDYGDRVTANAGNDKEIAAMVELARAKGWEKVSLTGSAEFQERAARAFVEAGFALDDPVLEQRARQAIEEERRRKEKERALPQEQQRVPRPKVETVPQPVQRPAPEPKASSPFPLLAGDWSGSTLGSPADGGPVLFTVKHGKASVYHHNQRIDGVVFEAFRSASGKDGLKGVANFRDHRVVLVIFPGDRVEVAKVKAGIYKSVNGDMTLVASQTGTVKQQQRTVARGLGKGRE